MKRITYSLLTIALILTLGTSCTGEKKEQTTENQTTCTTNSSCKDKCKSTDKCTGTNKCTENTKSCSKKTNCCNNKTITMKKYDNDYYYENGKLNAEKALNAYKELIEAHGETWTPFLEKNFWITDFGLGDFANVGMAGVFWVNDEEHKYFAHEIYLLPGQMIVEHKHMKTKFPAKMETWHVRRGKVFTVGEGETTPNNPAFPKSQEKFITVSNATPVNAGELSTLNRIEAPHFMIADQQSGAIVAEYANYHDGTGLVFTNPKVVFSDIRQQ